MCRSISQCGRITYWLHATAVWYMCREALAHSTIQAGKVLPLSHNTKEGGLSLVVRDSNPSKQDEKVTTKTPKWRWTSQCDRDNFNWRLSREKHLNHPWGLPFVIQLERRVVCLTMAHDAQTRWKGVFYCNSRARNVKAIHSFPPHF